jgi:subfamily B ATP-binding cassette protein HlyB/CyaB
VTKETNQTVLRSRTGVGSLRTALWDLWRLVKITRPYWSELRTTIAIGATVNAITAILPYLSMLLVDGAYPTRDHALMNVLVFGIAAIGVVVSLLTAINTQVVNVAATKMAASASLGLLEHTLHLPQEHLDRMQVGDLQSRFADIRTSLSFATRVIVVTITQSVVLLIVPLLLVSIDLKLALLALSAMPVTAAINAIVGQRVRRRFLRSAEAAAKVNARQLEILTHISTLKSMALERFALRSVAKQHSESVQLSLEASQLQATVSLTSSLVRSASVLAYSWLAWTYVFEGSLTLGTYLAFTAYLGLLASPVSQVSSTITTFQVTSAALARVFEILDLRREDFSTAFAQIPPNSALSGHVHVEFQSVSVERAGQHVLKNASFAIGRGESVAIVGKSGAGKTTLLKLVPGLVQPTRGRLRWDGKEMSAECSPRIRRTIGAVWQESGLTSGTILETITFGVDEWRIDDVWDALTTVQARRFVESLPKGLETEVGEWGKYLSGGQRQRLLIARALMRKPELLLLDEATSSLDSETERAVMSALLSDQRGTTVIFVAHRPETALLADYTCTVEGGHILSYGRSTLGSTVGK